MLILLILSILLSYCIAIEKIGYIGSKNDKQYLFLSELVESNFEIVCNEGSTIQKLVGGFSDFQSKNITHVFGDFSEVRKESEPLRINDQAEYYSLKLWNIDNSEPSICFSSIYTSFSSQSFRPGMKV